MNCRIFSHINVCTCKSVWCNRNGTEVKSWISVLTERSYSAETSEIVFAYLESRTELCLFKQGATQRRGAGIPASGTVVFTELYSCSGYVKSWVYTRLSPLTASAGSECKYTLKLEPRTTSKALWDCTRSVPVFWTCPHKLRVVHPDRNTQLMELELVLAQWF